MGIVISFILGALAWTLTEYGLHRGLGHKGGLKNPFTVEHLAHHANTSYYAPTYKKLIATAIAFAIVAPPVFLLLGAAGVSGIVGFLVMYTAYEIVHRRLHEEPSKGRYGRWARRHHLHHHYRRPQLNHGVTTPLWDFVFGTLEVPDVVRVPRRNAHAWMLDENGELKEEWSQDYVLVGRKSKEQRLAEEAAAAQAATADDPADAVEAPAGLIHAA